MKTLYTINQKKHATHTNITIGDPETSLQNICVTGRDHAKHAVLIEASPDLLEALQSTLNAMRDLIRQLPNDESLADFRLDSCEIAEQKAIEAIKKAQP